MIKTFKIIDANQYNPFSLLTSILRIPCCNVFKKLKYFLLFMICYAAVIGFLDYKIGIHGNPDLGQFHLLFSFCLTIIIGFRINVSYSRWWEARGHWGTLVNNCRNLAIKFNSYVGFENNADFKNYIAKFPLLLKYHLQHNPDTCSQIMDKLGIIHNEEHLPNLLIQKIVNKISYCRTSNQINLEQFLALDQHISELTDVLGGCEKILNTLPPSGFRIFTRFALLFYILIFPFGWFDNFGFFIIPIIIVIIYILLGLEVIAEEMEEPFSDNYDDSLPLEIFSKNIENNINEIAKMPRN